jgi:hypothetical protein
MIYDFTVFRGFVGAHWVVAQGTADTVEAAHDAAAFDCAGRILSRQLDDLVKEVEAANALAA